MLLLSRPVVTIAALVAVVSAACDRPPIEPDGNSEKGSSRTLSGEAARLAAEQALLRAEGPNDPRFSVMEYSAGDDRSGLRPTDEHVDDENCDPAFRYKYSWLLDEEGSGFLEQGAYSEMHGECFVRQIEHYMYAYAPDWEFGEHYAQRTAYDQSLMYFLSERNLDCSDSDGGVEVEATADHVASSSTNTTYGRSGPATNECGGGEVDGPA